MPGVTVTVFFLSDTNATVDGSVLSMISTVWAPGARSADRVVPVRRRRRAWIPSTAMPTPAGPFFVPVASRTTTVAGDAGEVADVELDRRRLAALDRDGLVLAVGDQARRDRGGVDPDRVRALGDEPELELARGVGALRDSPSRMMSALL